MQTNKQQQRDYIKGVIEALLFVNEQPVTLDQLKKVLATVTPSEVKASIQMLQQEHEQRRSGMNIVEIAGGYQMLSNPSYAGYIREFYKTKHKEKLSKPALETLAIIAYKQPVTRSDVELIRGVNSDGVVSHLNDKELIKIVGRKDVPGRPYLYGTTKQFLEYFGLKSLENLPKLEEFADLEDRQQEAQAQNKKAFLDLDENGEQIREGEDPVEERTLPPQPLFREECEPDQDPETLSKEEGAEDESERSAEKN